MFDQQKYITRGIQSEIPDLIQDFIWKSIDCMDISPRDYLQVFHLEQFVQSGIDLQRIIHRQEQPMYSKEYFLKPVSSIVETKVFVIDDGPYCTMLLAEEY